MKSGWQIKNLGDLCDILDYKRKPITKRDRIAGEYPYYGATGVLDHVHGYLFDEPLVLVGEDGAKWGSGENTAFVIEGKCWVNNHAHVLRPDRTKILDNWLIYHLNHSDLTEYVSGLTVPKLNQGSLREIPIPVPPLPEQQRIVSILDEAFDGIATAKANTEKNLQNARALFESHLLSVFTQRNEGWMRKRLEDVCVLQRGFDLPTRSRVPGDFPLVSSSGIIDTHIEGPIKGPGVATGRSGSIGRVFYIEANYWPLNTVLYVKQFHDNNPKFVYWLLNQFNLKRFATGSGVPTLNRNFVHDEHVFIPESKTIQEIIAKQLDAVAQETQHLEAIYQNKLSALEALKKSLLHDAFRRAL